MRKLAIACALAAQACGHVPILAGTTSALMSGTNSGGGPLLCGGGGGAEAGEPCVDGGGGATDPRITLAAIGVVVVGIAGFITYRLLFTPD